MLCAIETSLPARRGWEVKNGPLMITKAKLVREIGKRTLYVVSDLIQNVLDGPALQDLILQLVHPDFNLSGGGGLESDTLGDSRDVNARTGMQVGSRLFSLGDR